MKNIIPRMATPKKHYSVKQIMKLWKLPKATTVRLFMPHITEMLIPYKIVEQVYRKHTNK